MQEQKAPPSATGKQVILVMLAVSLAIAILRWKFVPRTNPKEADPGNPYYSPPLDEDRPRERRKTGGG